MTAAPAAAPAAAVAGISVRILTRPWCHGERGALATCHGERGAPAALPRMGCVAGLKDKLRADLNTAMRARDQVRMRTLRMALTSITNEEVAGASARDLSDEEVVKVLTREAKKRREAAEAFGAAGRDEQAAAERAEGDVLATYLPAQLGDDELVSFNAAATTETG